MIIIIIIILNTVYLHIFKWEINMTFGYCKAFTNHDAAIASVCESFKTKINFKERDNYKF